ncbi:MAG: tRNA (guanosine(37)-N1)-methyltransferase TrmD [Deltaproteobacteria bacterium]|nr:tRNA (guanosine(37)-N1)-methyltransferase TrmD [Deltaproteobacteria bacterium]
MTAFRVLTLFPDLLSSAFHETAGLLGKAVKNSVISVTPHDLRAYGIGQYNSLDDEPYGGGGGMLMRVEPWSRAIADVRAAVANVHVVMLSPAAQPLTQARVRRLAERDAIALCCPRYEGVDERVLAYCDEVLSLGDFVLSGGEYAALCVIDAVARLRPGFMGKAEAPVDESYAHPGRIEHAQYTRPPSFEGRDVPKVLMSGNHKDIAAFRRASQLARTVERRPDLLQRFPLLREEWALLRAPPE